MIFLEYEISVHTGKVMNSGTDANVYIKMYGENGESETHHLSRSRKNPDPSKEEGNTDLFLVHNGCIMIIQIFLCLTCLSVYLP